MRLPLVVFAASCVAFPALAVLPPEAYERARAQAPHVVVLTVRRVDWNGGLRGAGHCRIVGTVKAVERGSHYRVGGPIEVKVPCARRGASIPAGPVLWKDPDRLKRSRTGRAYMSEPGELARSQYEVLN